MLSVYIKTLAREFYAQHAGLFIFLFYMIFAAVEPGQMLSFHLSLLIGISASPVILGIFLLLFTVYTLKGFLFIRQKLSQDIYQFIYISNAAARKTQILNWFGIYVVICLPILIYALMLFTTAILHGHYITILALCLYPLGLFYLMARMTYQRINYQFTTIKIPFNIELPGISKPYWTWPLYYLLKEQVIMLLICKLLSFVLFKSIIWAFAGDTPDVRVYMIAILAAILSHTTLIATVLRYEKVNLSFVNSLPLPGWKRLAHTVVFIVLLLLPEFILYSIASGFSPYIVITGIMFGVSGLLLLRLSLYFLGDDMDRYLKFIFCFFVTAMTAIIFSQFLLFSLLMLTLVTAYHYYLFNRNML